MTRIFTFLSFMLAVAVVAGTLVGLPGPSVLQAQEEQRVDAIIPGANCRPVEVALDEGYGVTRRALRTECSVNQ
jgi:hypothetical protein